MSEVTARRLSHVLFPWVSLRRLFEMLIVDIIVEVVKRVK